MGASLHGGWSSGTGSRGPFHRRAWRASQRNAQPARRAVMMFHDQDAGGAVATLDENPSARDQGKATPANWTVLASLAGDNDLEGALLGDLREMERVGSRPGSVEILAQVDRARGHDTSGGNWTGTRRYYVTRSPGRDRIGSTLLAELGETNTGDPRVLKDFLAFG